MDTPRHMLQEPRISPADMARAQSYEGLYWEAYRAAQYSIRAIVWNDCPAEFDAEQREAWWAGTCGGNSDRRQA